MLCVGKQTGEAARRPGLCLPAGRAVPREDRCTSFEWALCVGQGPTMMRAVVRWRRHRLPSWVSELVRRRRENSEESV